MKQNEHTRYECKIGGSPEIKVLWYKDEVEIQESSKFRMSFEDSVAVMEMYSLGVEDSGDYTCEARNAAGSASSSTSLKVKGQALLCLHPAHQLLSCLLHAQFGSLLPQCFKIVQGSNLKKKKWKRCFLPFSNGVKS